MTDTGYKQPVDVRMHADGRIERLYSSGRREEIFPNGTIMLHVLVDGCIPYSTVIMPLKPDNGEQSW
ncbi:MAG: hypothetical protein J4400_04075 [Candidatus Aenigmarchaeota archaeon]|nr:hypothetical protein [Candidatus Aenigmarchaeota archaeon]